jgi:hypothetical protein
VCVTGDHNHIISDGGHVTKALLEIQAQPILQHWLHTAQHCPRLLPFKDHVCKTYPIQQANNAFLPELFIYWALQLHQCAQQQPRLFS